MQDDQMIPFVDPNKIASEIVTKQAETVVKLGKDLVNRASIKLISRFRRTYKTYLSCIAAKYSKSKSFLIRDEPTSLKDFYVPLGLKSARTRFEAAYYDDLQRVAPLAIITGAAGCGKSILMKYLLLDAMRTGDRIPVFIELRKVNGGRSPSLRGAIAHSLSINHLKVDEEFVEAALQSGYFSLFLDGFDEVDHTVRVELAEEIMELARRHDRNVLVVSSRPDTQLGGWEDFRVFEIEPLTKKQAVRLIQLLPFESEVKEKFVEDLRGHLFDDHRSFLSNPLLLSIMLLTYGQYAEIPTKLSVFYEQAYETLFQKHDAYKGAFKRKRKTTLDISDFARVFAAFAIQTYDTRVLQFSRSEAVEIARRCRRISGLKYDSTDFVEDALQAVCLLLEDGVSLTFSHRSFQDFFAAKFIVSTTRSRQRRLISRYSKNFYRDTLLPLLFELSPHLVETHFILPTLESERKRIGLKRDVGKTHYRRWIKPIIAQLGIDSDGSINGLTFDDEHGVFLLEFQRFVLGKLGASVGCEHIPPSARLSRKLTSELIAQSEPDEYRGHIVDIRTCEQSTHIVDELYSSGGWLSAGPLRVLFSIEKAIRARHAEYKDSLDDILRME